MGVWPSGRFLRGCPSDFGSGAFISVYWVFRCERRPTSGAPSAKMQRLQRCQECIPDADREMPPPGACLCAFASVMHRHRSQRISTQKFNEILKHRQDHAPVFQSSSAVQPRLGRQKQRNASVSGGFRLPCRGDCGGLKIKMHCVEGKHLGNGTGADCGSMKGHPIAPLCKLVRRKSPVPHRSQSFAVRTWVWIRSIRDMHIKKGPENIGPLSI